MPITIKKEIWGIRKTFICTREDPYTKEKAKGCRPVQHPDAEFISSEPNYDTYKCPYCGKVFNVSLPDY